MLSQELPSPTTKRLVELAHENEMPDVLYNHMGRPGDDFDFLGDYLPMMLPNVVADRFHLGGIVWHNCEITPCDLRFIEGHLYTQGSVVVVMYDSHEGWYTAKMEEEGDRHDLFDIDVRAKANNCYFQMVDGGLYKDGVYYEPLVDIEWDVHEKGYPSDLVLLEWLRKWKARLASYERFIEKHSG